MNIAIEQPQSFTRHELSTRHDFLTGGLPDDLINFQHDPLACAVALGWDGVTTENTHVRTELRDGWLYEQVDASGREMRVVTAVDGVRFNEFWLGLVT